MSNSAAGERRSRGDAVGSVLRDAAFLLGLGLTSYGAWLIYQPAAFIVVGVTLLGSAIWGALR